MKKSDLEKIAKGLLEQHPDKNAIYMTEDGQAFFNKDARNNHSKSRGGLKEYDFFRSGVPTPQETADAVEALEAATEKLKVAEACMENIEKVLVAEDHGITVNTDTHPLVATAIGVREQLAEAKAAHAQDTDALKQAGDALVEKDKEIKQLQADLKKANDALAKATKK